MISFPQTSLSARFLFLMALLATSAAHALDSVVTINEIMYHPADDTGEWVELHNQMAVDVDLSGWRLSGGIDYRFPENTVIPSGGYVVVALNPGTLSGSIGPFSGRLSNDTDTLRLRNNSDRVMDEVTYGDGGRWPVAPDGSGAALAKRQPGLASDDPANWSFRTLSGGTPGGRNFRDASDPGVAATFEDTVLLTFGSSWRYNESGTDPGQGWAGAPHPAGGGWQQGDGMLGFDPDAASAGLPTTLVGYWSFNNGEVPANSGTAAALIQRGSGSAGQDGVFLGTATRTDGIVGGGAAQFNNGSADGVNIGMNFSFSSGLTIEMVAIPQWNGSGYGEFLRKEDGGNRILFSFQNDSNNPGANPPVAAGPVLSFGLNTGGYKELDMPLDGANGRPALAELTDGNPHHFAATYDAASGEKAIWIDGTKRFSVMQTAGTTISSGGGAAAVIGNHSGGGEPFSGVIDEFALYNTALSGTDIASHATAALASGNYFGSLSAPIETPLSDPLANAPYAVSTYFETEFSISATELANLQQLRLRHIVDDGAAFYINGTEIERFNLPAGVLSASTLATADVDNASFVGPLVISPSALVAGVNRLSVEVHQSGTASDDIVFDARLEATIQTSPAVPPGGDPVPQGEGLMISEISAAGAANFRIELVNNSPASIDLAGFEIVNTSSTLGGSYVLPTAVLPSGGFAVFDHATLGFSAAAQDRLFLYAPSRSDVLDAAEVKVRPCARLSGAERDAPFFTPDSASFGFVNSITFEDSIVINEIMYHHAPQYPIAELPEIVEMETLLAMSDVWRFNQSGSDLGGGWQNATHPVGGTWQSGNGPLGFAAGFGGGAAPDTPLIQDLHYSDTFTTTGNGGAAGRTGTFPVGLPGIHVENNHGNPARTWSNSLWSLDTDGTINDPSVVFVGSGNGSATGMTQTGGGVDYGIEYGLSDHFVVSFDAFQPSDRIDITAGSSRDSIASGLAVFFRTDGHAAADIGIYNPGAAAPAESDTGFKTGISSINQWHNYAVRFDTINNEIEFYVDEVSRGVLDLTTFAGGKYSGLASNVAVSVGGTATTGNRFWSDNFQIGTPVGGGGAGTLLNDPALNSPEVVTYYFETDFSLTAQQLTEISELELTHFVDDGAVFYINGSEVGRVRMPAGAVSASTRATVDVNSVMLEGSLTIPTSVLIAGTNRLSVEVHQSGAASTDVMFGASLAGVRIISSGSPGSPLVENDEEWIELHNRSGSAVDVSDWKLEGAVSFNFTSGTIIDPGEYVLLARDAAALGNTHPGVRILGSFSGKLANGDDFIRVEDADRNPVDEVHYFDGGRWPASADGGGSSLELRDSAADNAVAEAWAASDETQGAAWQTITYRGFGNAPTGSSDPSGYHELLMGLLDSGEFFLDDVSVIEDPDGTARQLIQNGGFDADAIGAMPAAWRVVGNHGDHGKTLVAEDPDNAANKVLYVVATGAQWHQHDHLETTLRDGANYVTIDPNKEYEISFRARWVTGSPQLNSRLYFNRVARTHILAQPTTAGTPGAANSGALGNTGPTFRNFGHSPLVPSAGQAVTVTVEAEDPNGVASVSVFWSQNGGAFSSLPMSADSNGLYSAELPGAGASTLVQFYVEATDVPNAISTFPAGGAYSRALFRVANGAVANLNLHNLSVLTTETDRAFLNNEIYVMGNHLVGATVVYGNEVFYNVGVQNKGSQRGRTDLNRRGLTIRFDPSEKFRGVNDSIGLDRSGGWRFGRSFGQDEILIHHILGRAGNIPSLNNDLVQMDGPNISSSTAQLQMARYGSGFLDGQYENGADGSLHNYELIYYPTTTTGGPEGRKRPLPDVVNGVAVRPQGGGDTEAYRYYFELRSNRDRDDYSGMIGLSELLALGGSAFTNTAPDIIDVDQWLRAFAAVSLCGVSDSYFNNSNAHNARFYQRPNDGRILLFPWDMDFAFMNAATSPLVANSDLAKLMSAPSYQRLFYQHVHDLIATSFNTSYMSPWISHYDSKLPGQGLTSISSYISSRVTSAQAQCSSAIPMLPFEITSNGGSDFSTGQSPVILEGNGWVDVREIRIDGSGTPLAVTWTSDTAWSVTLPLAGGANAVSIRAYDLQGNLVGSDMIEITNTGTVVAPLPGELAITELMYHPVPATEAEVTAGFTDKEDFEFVELLNLSSQILDLGGVRFVNGVNIVLPAGLHLDPGERLVIVENLAAFNQRYPNAAIHSGGEVLGGGQFSNNGERVTIHSASGAVLVDFTYSDSAPWPISADGVGYSLVSIAPGRTGGADLNNPINWRCSRDLGGSPGASDTLSFVDWAAQTGALADPNADEDFDQRSNYMEYLMGTVHNVPDIGGVSGAFEEDPLVPGQNHLTLSFVNFIGADDAQLSAQFSAELEVWSGDEMQFLGETNNGDGTRTLRFRFLMPLRTSDHQFGRLRADAWE